MSINWFKEPNLCQSETNKINNLKKFTQFLNKNKLKMF